MHRYRDPIGQPLRDHSLGIVPGFNLLIETSAAEDSVLKQSSGVVIRVESLPVRYNVVLVEQVDRGAGKGEFLALVILVHLEGMGKVQVGLRVPRRASSVDVAKGRRTRSVDAGVNPVPAAPDVRALNRLSAASQADIGP